MNANEMKLHIANGGIDSVLTHIYGEAAVAAQKARYSSAIDEFAAIYGADRDISLYSVAGRSELSGNHTDHNHGCVVAASIDLDIIAVASAREDSVIRIKSEGFPEDVVDFSAYNAPVEAKFGSSESIIAGMVQGFLKDGYKVGGFDAYTTSNVLKGSGLSSSAAFEDMVGNILNYLYNNGNVDNVEIAKLAQYSENVHFGKPCGLMDQTACAVGGFVAIDFKDPGNPIVEKLPFDLDAEGISLCITNTGGNHADLNEDYASVPADMKAAAKFLGVEVLRETTKENLLANATKIRESLGDMCLLRALHFFNENERVTAQRDALEKGNLDAFLEGVLKSGNSSAKMLQNVYTVKNVKEQGLTVALALAAEVLDGTPHSAYRVHGGGFAGTIQSFVPKAKVAEFTSTLEAVFGEGNVYVLSVRKYGAVMLDKLA